jgi:two-component system, cell cycle sensor histidine kinase and response regulator CckA
MEAEWWKAVLLCMGDGVLVVDRDGAVLFGNSAAEAILRTKLQGAVLSSWVGRVFRADGTTPYAYEELPPIRAGGGEIEPPTDVVVRWASARVNVASRPFRDADGNLRGSVSVLRDVTEQRHAEDELRQANRFIDSIVENLPDMIFVKDAENLRFERFNRAGEDLLGIPRDKMLGKNDYDFFPKDQADFFQSRDRETLRQGRLVDTPEEPIDTSRGRRWLHTKKIPILDERGRPTHLLGISSDITDQHEAEEALKRVHEDLERRVLERTEELRRAEEQLRHAQKLEAVGRLAGGVAHDFNNVLAVILGHVGLLAAGLPEGDPVASRLDPIREAAEHAAALTRQLLAFSRKQVMQTRILNLNRVVEQTRGMLARLLGEDVELVAKLSPNMGNILADPALIEQVIINLAVNARDAMPNGGVLQIETESVAVTGNDDTALPAGKYALLIVTDNGVGMDAETRSRAFEPFFTTKAPGKGTGLGLSMVYGVVAQSGGTIRVESETGRGTTFSVYLPCASGPRALTPSPSRAYVVRGGGETVLIAEDEAPLREVLKATLEHAGYRVLDAGSASDALDLCSRHEGPVHLLLSDVVMPAMDGPELARRLRGSRPEMRVLFMSGYTDERLAGHEFSQSQQHLKKPFSPEVLTATVRAVLDS